MTSWRLSLAVAGVTSLTACRDPKDFCEEDMPGIRFVVHLNVSEPGPPVDTGIVYANGAIEHFGDRVPPAPWPDPLTFCVSFGAEAVDGPAEVSFQPRPEGSEAAHVEIQVDLTQRIDAELTVNYYTDVDAGL